MIGTVEQENFHDVFTSPNYVSQIRAISLNKTIILGILSIYR